METLLLNKFLFLLCQFFFELDILTFYGTAFVVVEDGLEDDVDFVVGLEDDVDFVGFEDVEEVDAVGPVPIGLHCPDSLNSIEK